MGDLIQKVELPLIVSICCKTRIEEVEYEKIRKNQRLSMRERILENYLYFIFCP